MSCMTDTYDDIFDNIIKKTNHFPTLELFISFLQSRCRLLESTHMVQNQGHNVHVDKNDNSTFKPRIENRGNVSFNVKNKNVCVVCHNNNFLNQCKNVIKVTV